MTKTSQKHSHCTVPLQDEGELPVPLTIFLTSRERSRVLRALTRFSRDRRSALLRALKLDDGGRGDG